MHDKGLIIVHIPHASLWVPEDITFELSKKELTQEVMISADMYIDDFIADCECITTIKSDISRVVVDMERFVDDTQEPAAKYGRGVIYTKTNDGRILRQDPTKEYREHLLQRFYYPHHKLLTDCVDKSLQCLGRALIIDLHSYSRSMIPLQEQKDHCPDVCIGYDEFHFDPTILDLIVAFCQRNGFSYAFNMPYSGALVPMKFYHRNNKVISFMLELNKALYMNERSFTKTKGYSRLKEELFILMASLYKHFRKEE